METIGQIVLGTYGVLIVVGGIMGFVKAGSRVSLFAGGISGGICIGATWLSMDHVKDGFTLGGLMAFLIAGVFINRLAKTRKFMPAGMVLILSLIVGVLLMIALQGVEEAVLDA